MKSDQPLWPLVLVASALAAVGYALALENPRPEVSSSPGYSVQPQQTEGGAGVATGRVKLRYQPGPARRLELRFEQVEGAGVSEVATRVDLEVQEERRRRPGGDSGVQFQRTYRKAGVSIGEGDVVVGPRISRQIESLLDGVKSVVEVDAIGKPLDAEWKSVTNPQVRQSLRVLRHAHSLLTPRPRRGNVNVGDSWTYRLSADHLDSQYVESIDGDVHIRESLADLVEHEGRQIAVIERTLEADASGAVRLPKTSQRHPFELSASGSGRARFATEEGALVESHLEVERTLEIKGNSAERSERVGRLEWRIAEKPRPGE